MVVLRVRRCHLRAGFQQCKSFDDDVLYLFLQKQKIGADLHIYLRNGHCEMLSFMAPISLTRGDGALGAGAEDCITSARRLWRTDLVSRPRRRPTRRRASPAPLSAPTVAGCQLG